MPHVLNTVSMTYARANPRKPKTTIDISIPTISMSLSTLFQITWSRLSSTGNEMNPRNKRRTMIPAQSQKPHRQDRPGAPKAPASRYPVCSPTGDEKERQANPKFLNRPLGTAEVQMLMFVGRNIAAPRPCKTRKTMNWTPEWEIPVTARETVMTRHPLRPMIRLPIKSASFPERRKQHPLARLRPGG